MITQKSAVLYAQLTCYKSLVERTRGFVKWALDRVDNPYLACSFGKDSSVLLHIVRGELPQIPVRFLRWRKESEIIDNYDDVIAKWGEINLEQVEMFRNSTSERVHDRFTTQGYDSYFVGLRMEESVGRRISLKTHGMFYKNKQDLIRISPLSDWKTDDIATYCLVNGLPLLNTYQTLGLDKRTASRVPRQDFGIREQFLADLKQRDFTAFQQLLINYPELRAI